MEELAKFLLTLDGREVTPVGMLLLAGVGLWRGWWVPGNLHNKVVTDCATVTESLKAANTELRAVEHDYVEARIELARLTERAGLPPKSAPRRR